MSNLKINPDHAPVIKLLQQCPMHKPTALTSQPSLAEKIGIDKLWIKNEGERMGLGSFKALGGSFAILSLICDAAGIPIDSTFELDHPDFRRAAREMTFICATAGNHGLAVAAASSLFGASAVVYIAESVPEEFANKLRAKNARVVRAGDIYEDALDAAVNAANSNGWTLVADTSNQNYQKIPALIYQGYSVLAEECRVAFEDSGQWPTHIYLQAGVGGMAASFAAHVRAHWSQSGSIQLVVVEPEAAPCLGKSVEAGHPVVVEGPVSSMGRLDCKETSLLCFESLSQTADAFVEISDDQAEDAVVRFKTQSIPTTPSGGAGLAALLKQKDLGELPATAKCLVIVSEGGLS